MTAVPVVFFAVGVDRAGVVAQLRLQSALGARACGVWLAAQAAIHSEVSHIAIGNLPERDRRCRLRPKDQVEGDEPNAANRTHQSVHFVS